MSVTLTRILPKFLVSNGKFGHGARELRYKQVSVSDERRAPGTTSGAQDRSAPADGRLFSERDSWRFKPWHQYDRVPAPAGGRAGEQAGTVTRASA
jgi:hypothetical protein